MMIKTFPANRINFASQQTFTKGNSTLGKRKMVLERRSEMQDGMVSKEIGKHLSKPKKGLLM